ncbi:MAG: excinuclease ABC subunit UvrC [Clostridiales Family XIII bacterium]|jgi:excinuclease ABC subunit C|nr:excinuclease ABC subunit UvrC [Clostridiales Family XIII bacterium]
MFDIRESLKSLPDRPGVYLHRDRYGEIIYVGKAASLRRRVRQYFQSARGMDAKARAMVSHIAEFEYITTDTEMEALILENSLIKRHMPRYNVLLRDDKTYPYIKLTMAEDYPRLLKTRVVANDGSRYFGPYADVKSANQVIDLLCDIYRLKRCPATGFPPGHRPCLNRHIDRCRGVCEGSVDREAYAAAIDSVTGFLNGRGREVTDYLRGRMQEAASRMDFEAAAAYRDSIAAAASVMEKQRVVLLSGGDMDLVLYAKGEKDAHVAVFFVRDGRLIGRESHHLQAADEDSPADVVSAFIKQHYANQSRLPKELLLEERLPDGALIEEWMSGMRGSGVRLRVPVKGEKKALLEMAKRDIAGAARLLDEKARTQRERDAAIGAALGGLLGLPAGEGRAWRVEAYDISNTGGADSVGAMVVFEGSRPLRQEYRRFRIRGAQGADDYGSMQEVVYRRMRRWQEGDAGFSPLPDLILVDGGRGHVGAVAQTLRAMGIDVPVAGMVKDDRHRTRGLVFGDTEADLKKSPLAYHFTGAVQEEVHRFAVEYHRGLRAKAATKSALDAIEGIGPKRRNALFAHFGSLEAIKAATVEQLAGAPGMTGAAAAKVKAHFSGAKDLIDNGRQ